ncbi:MAG: RDD family protein [Moraxellaceae bacterium]|nr:RDD family protein [Moraxellaceae bacterium]MDZ4386076.1 RDD family protein [Moraxellaceae bacterium]
MSRHRKAAKKSPQQTAPVQVDILPRAPVWVRLAALVYDGLLVIALLAITNAILVAIVTPSEAASNQDFVVLSANIRYGLLLPASLLVIYLFYGYCWKRGGQTLGMQTWRLSARRRDGDLMTWGDALKRCFAAVVMPFLLALLAWRFGATSKGVAVFVGIGFLFNYAWAWLPISRLPPGLCLHDLISNTDVLRLPKKAKASK